MTRATIKIKFLDWWQAGTGKSGESDADMIAHRDQWGCPALPGSQLKGILRESARDRAIWGVHDITKYFGEETNKGTPGLAQSGGLAFPENATLTSGEQGWFHANPGARGALFSMLHATAIDEVTGTAKDRSLRLIEVAVPMTLTAEIVWVGKEEPPKDWTTTLDILCALTPAFGKQTHDGLGRAIACCEEIACSEEPQS
jgi:hypothetical protein